MKKTINKGIAILVATLIVVIIIMYALLQQNYMLPLLGDAKTVTITVFNWNTTFILQGTKPLDFTPLIRLGSQLWSAYMMTLIIVFWTALLSFGLGWLVFFGLRAKGVWLFVHYLFKAFHDFMLAVPLIVFIIIFYYFIAPAYGMKDPLIIGVFMLALYSSVYIYQVYESAISAIPTSQFESAKMLGMNTIDTYRYIIIPQMIRNSIPPLVGQLSGIIKNSALLSYVAISEFTNVVNQIKANSFVIFESYIVLAIGYLILTIPLIYIASYIEKRLRGEKSGA
ncbi:MAG: amino acid ABC transporter permease [Culicoidibacterales bacterium]